MREVLLQNEQFPGEIVFSPLLYKKKDIPRNIEESRLDIEALIEFGKLATRAKKRFNLALETLDE